jgi:hypothetical protein
LATGIVFFTGALAADLLFGFGAGLAAGLREAVFAAALAFLFWVLLLLT